ncbi:hypothetical protein J2Y58_004014 [Sphingomonas sp. BE138]|uniref:hypothetical protein n=1 Tax=Sphingomonas sp. BE138 TaxID=2817845 RepID=UPI00285FEA60|nr:hypothetical protein [Sphingomonas sp. BE138]MDR6790631.1 hypothetical protein [Sphingomonas sp. BE138]
MKELIPREEAIGPVNPSIEHVIPYALGGSDDLATRDCCAGAPHNCSFQWRLLPRMAS